MKGILSFFWELFKTVFLALVIVLPIRFFVFEPFVVKGASMEPNFYQGDYLIIDKLSFHFREPKRGEVIVLRYPLNPKQRFIKRIVALPGEEIAIEGGKVKVNGKILDESKYLPNFVETPGDLEVSLSQNQYFVLGDNRSASFDSRQWGPLQKKEIIGRVLLDFRLKPSFPFLVVQKIPLPVY